MEKFLEQTLLYDFYGELLTEHQRAVYEEVVLNDCSLSEAASDFGISRQGVHDLVKRCNAILEGYEAKLHLLERFLAAKRMVNEINELTRQFNEDGSPGHVARIQELSNEILRNF
jgi:hypothetical protein